MNMLARAGAYARINKSQRACIGSSSSSKVISQLPLGTRYRNRNARNYLVNVTCQGVTDNKETKQNPARSSRQEKRIQKFKETLQKSGVTGKTAQRIVDVWQRTGLDDPNRLRRLLLRRSAVSVLTTILQLGLDLGAAYAAYNTGLLWGITNQFDKFTPIAQAPLFLLAGYFAAGVFFDFFTLGMLAVATFKFQTSSTAFAEAVKEIAGTTGLNVVDKATQAVNTVKVVNALNQMMEALKEGGGDGSGMLSNLSAYLTLDKAREELDFDPKDFGLTDEEAAKLAGSFSRFDSNDDGKLSQQEFQQLSSALDGGLSGDEVVAAFKMLDTDQSGFIDFAEFVQWYQGRVPAGKVSK